MREVQMLTHVIQATAGIPDGILAAADPGGTTLNTDGIVGFIVAKIVPILLAVVGVIILIGGIVYGIVPNIRDSVNEQFSSISHTIKGWISPSYSEVHPAPDGTTASTYVRYQPGTKAVDTHKNTFWAMHQKPGVEPVLENWLRQRGKALYTAEGNLAFDADDMTEWFKLWAKLRDAGAVVSPDDQALDTGPLESTMVALGKAAVTYANSNQLIAFQQIIKDPVNITAFPRIAKDAKGGHYRKPSMFWSVAQQSKLQSDSAKYLSFFINDKDAAPVIGVDRGIPCSAAVRDAIALRTSTSASDT